LAQLPAAAPDATVLVQAGDLVTASEAAGVERPDDLDGQALVDWLGPLTGGPGAEETLVFVPIASLFNAPRLLQHEEFADELGFSVLDAEAFVEQSTPPRRSRWSPATWTAPCATTCPRWPTASSRPAR